MSDDTTGTTPPTKIRRRHRGKKDQLTALGVESPGESQAAPDTKPDPGTQLARRSTVVSQALAGLMPSSMGEAVQLSTHLAASEAIPQSLKRRPDTVLTLILAGLEIGLPPMRAIQNIVNIKGNLTMKADLQLAVVRQSGLLAWFDESFEVKGQTDTDLQQRTKDGAKILALVKNVPDGKPYGWTTVQRAGEPQLVTRTFTWTDAEAAFTYDLDETTGQKTGDQKKLSEKFNFVSWPADMYPKRSRGRALAIVFGDVLAGMRTTEAMQDSPIDVEVVDAGKPADVEALLTAIQDQDPDLAKKIEQGFVQLAMGRSKQLLKLTQFRNCPADLLAWLKNEWAGRKGSKMKPPTVLDAEPPPETPKAPDPDPPDEKPISGLASDEPQQADPKPPTQTPPPASQPKGGMTSVKSIAERFKGMKF